MLDLARHYLPDMSPETIQRAFEEVRDDLLEVLARKQRRERDVRDQAAAAEREAEHQEAELARITEALNSKVDERQKLEALVAERLHQTEEFKRLSEQALAAERELQRNEERVAEIRSEAKKKMPSFERSRLFEYLHKAGYGTPDYQANGLTRRLDAWVARMIDYPAARRSYEFLRVTPELIEQEVAQRRERFNELMQQVEAIEDRVSDELGLTAVMRAGQQLGAERDRAVAAAAKAQDEALKKQQELLVLAGSKSEFYEQALARMQNFLTGLPPTRLADQSRSTPEREDDAIVAEVTFLSGQLAEVDQRTALLVRERQQWEERLGGLQFVLQQFRHAEFDSRRSVFAAELNVEGLVQQVLDGQLSPSDLWAAVQRAQQFVPEWHERPGWPPPMGRGMGDVVIGEVSQVLLHVLTEVAGAAMRNSAYRGMDRRSASRDQQRKSAGRPPFPQRGFTRGRGF